MSDLEIPESLRARIAGSLRPVRPLRPPGRRALTLLPIALALLFLFPLLFGVGMRADFRHIGLSRLVLGSMLEIGIAVWVFAFALRESIPGRLSSESRVAVYALIGVASVVLLTYLTFAASPTGFPASREFRYLVVCLRRSLLLGAVPLALAGIQLGRGLAPRPIAAGALAGMAAGLAADSAMRVYCEVSAPAHVLTAHAGGIVTLTAAGALLSWGLSRSRWIHRGTAGGVLT
jgi:hypothetical protein